MRSFFFCNFKTYQGFSSYDIPGVFFDEIQPIFNRKLHLQMVGCSIDISVFQEVVLGRGVLHDLIGYGGSMAPVAVLQARRWVF